MVPPPHGTRGVGPFSDQGGGRPHRVERSLYQRANGYNYEAVKIFMPAAAKTGRRALHRTHSSRRHAVYFLAEEPRSAHWRDGQQLDHVLGKYIISDTPMTEEQWAKSELMCSMSSRRLAMAARKCIIKLVARKLSPTGRS